MKFGFPPATRTTISRKSIFTILFATILVASRLSVTVSFLPKAKLARTLSTTSIMASITNDTVKHIDEEELPSWFLKERTKILSKDQPTFTKSSSKAGSVVYWMQRDMRTVDNWALLLTQHYASVAGLPLRVVYCLPPPPPQGTSGQDDGLPPKVQDLPMTQRHGTFLVGGMEEVHKELQAVNVPLHMLQPESHETVGETVDQMVAQYNVKLVVCDFSPLRHFRQWTELQTKPLLAKRKIPFFQVDAHNVVPVWHASPKREVGARTLRSKINKVASDFTQDFPSFQGNSHLSKEQVSKLELPEFRRQQYETFLKMDDSVPTCDWATPGTKGGMEKFKFFVEQGGLKQFDTKRNDPTEPHVCSDMSPWLNYGHVAFQTLLLRVKTLNKYASGVASFVEEGLIRKELSDNYVYYTPDDYDSLDAAAGWAKETLEAHISDEREYIYTLEEFAEGKTHDDLWNAAQLQVVREGRMHGFLRMYWAKKILEWTETPLVALRTAQYLNDRFALDGKDPNGFVGVSWSIFGLHDQGWKEREIFGKIRFMNYNGCKRKFKVETFVGKYSGASKNALEASKKHGKGGAGQPPKKKQKKS